MLDPILIDTATFTHEQQQRCGQLQLQALDRRVWSHELLAQRDGNIQYKISGGIDRWQCPFIDISIEGELQLVCQRCLQAVSWALNDQSHIVLFASEQLLDEAMAADGSLEGAVWSAEYDLAALVEDQILMAIPVAPRHEDCDHTLAIQTNQDSGNPFARLAGLKSGH
ncbi:hypothetical protein BGI40_06200 [Snodgrassella communis]|uniref:Large ribosomal RNA subunit accumulation protein YceD n=1 Tax=Snodgrassella communis TaxID=2946699 RepID=A0A066TIB8_9NEIS|nr:YceD family protein [Snodgrassella communis]KDN13257.1 putative ribosomal protein [Snodgrassella communis]KDN14486.1 putative ribosomal protein [Snodgrassella communis]PIT06864.1 hypothetical protein BGI29_10275 [Snodgrassella communis]PIT26583.1 hypothetical protein BGI39_09900 [Snodgrassella communis]PIT29287.1 hypothetical protein BGI38_03880 [Snodgrassella communis]